MLGMAWRGMAWHTRVHVHDHTHKKVKPTTNAKKGVGRRQVGKRAKQSTAEQTNQLQRNSDSSERCKSPQFAFLNVHISLRSNSPLLALGECKGPGPDGWTVL